MFPDWEHRLQSLPMPVHWAGFESTTARLQQCGWEFSAEQDYSRLTTRLLMRHQAFRMHACSDMVDTDFFRMANPTALRASFPFRIQWMTSGNVQVRIHDDFSKFSPVDMQPTMIEHRQQRIEDFALFAAPLVRTREVIVDPHSVPELMDRILELQAPAAKKHFEEQIRRRGEQGARLDQMQPQQRFHAQVMSLVA